MQLPPYFNDGSLSAADIIRGRALGDESSLDIRKVSEFGRLLEETSLTLCRSNIKFLPAYLVLSSSSIALIEVKIFSI